MPLVRKGQQKIRKGRAQTHSAFGHTDSVKLPSGLNRRTRKRCPRFVFFRLPGYFEKRNVLRLNLLLYTVQHKIVIKTNFFDCFDIFSKILSVLRTKLPAQKSRKAEVFFDSCFPAYLVSALAHCSLFVPLGVTPWENETLTCTKGFMGFSGALKPL